MNSHLNPQAEYVDALSYDDFELLKSAVAARKCRSKIGFSTYEEALAAYRPTRVCPYCSSSDFRKDGKTPSDLQRYYCKACSSRYSVLSGTIFEYSKKDLSTWVDFITMMCHNVQVDAAADMCGISHHTAFEWRHRVMATIDDYQDRIKLSKRVWIDETYVTDTSLLGDSDWLPKRGLSKNKICIAVGIDIYKNPIAVVCGHGKPTSKRIKEAFQGRIAKGATIVHDMEKSHGSLVKAVSGIDEPYRANTKDPAYLEGMEMINNLCSWIKRYLWRFPGMKAENLQSYLNWYIYLFKVTRDKEKWPKVERVVRHLMLADATFRRSKGISLPHGG
jgi:transposase-like protein